MLVVLEQGVPVALVLIAVRNRPWCRYTAFTSYRMSPWWISVSVPWVESKTSLSFSSTFQLWFQIIQKLAGAPKGTPSLLNYRPPSVHLVFSGGATGVKVNIKWERRVRTESCQSEAGGGRSLVANTVMDRVIGDERQKEDGGEEDSAATEERNLVPTQSTWQNF